MKFIQLLSLDTIMYLNRLLTVLEANASYTLVCETNYSNHLNVFAGVSRRRQGVRRNSV